jgi:multiple sugar transport system substrate-binding protein
MLTDQATGTDSFQGFLFAPAWLPDFVTPGYLEDLGPYIDADEAIEWDDIAPFFRDFVASYAGSTYAIPVDGDFHIAYYRTDVFEDAGIEPPRTWDEWLEAAEALNGTDMNGDGEGDFGSCIAKQRGGQGFWWIHTIAGPYLQSQGTQQGIFFNPDDFTPLINNAGFIRALEIYSESTNYGPPDELNWELGDMRSAFLSGRCALALDWGDIGPLSIDESQSTVADVTGSLITPGTREVVDWETGELVPCDEATCPFAVDGVNFAPFASFGGWAGGVSAAASDEDKQVVYDFFSYIAQPAQANVDVTIGATGYNPYRLSQFESTDQWVEAGFSEAGAENYLGAIEDSLNSPNMILDLRVPNAQRYQQVVLDEVVARFLAGELSAEEAAEEITVRWEEITDELGRDEQLAAYRGSLGLE